MSAIQCPLCGSSKKSVLRTRVRYGIRRKVFTCGSCAMVYLEPAKGGMKQFYAGKEYRKRYGPVLGHASAAKKVFETYALYQQPIVDQLKPILKKDMKVLDVGCSAGQFLNSLKGLVRTRVGLELSADEVAFIRKELGFKVYDRPIEEVTIKEGPFDLITCLQTLEHVENPVNFLRHLGKNLKPNGYLYLELPNIDDVLITRYEVSGYADFYYREPHLSYFSKKTLRDAVKKAGFTGQIGNVQRYSLLNHIHWIQTGLPQSDFRIGNSTPALIPGARDVAGKELNLFIRDADIRYKQLLKKLGLGESLTFLGKKK